MSRSGNRRRSRQRGVALITVLLIFALVTLMASEMIRSGYLAMRRTESLRDASQARLYALGGEELGRQMLYADFRRDKGGETADHLGEAWATETDRFEIEQGELELAIRDLQGRFNLNNLLGEEEKLDAGSYARLERMLKYLELPRSLAESLLSLMRISGRGKDMTLRPLLDVSELRAMTDVDADTYAALLEHVTVLAPGTKININTATDAVLMAHTDDVKQFVELERIVHNLSEERQKRPVIDLEAFMATTNGSVFSGSVDMLGSQSMYFVVRSKAFYAGRRAYLETRLQRDEESGELAVLRRSLVPADMDDV